MAYKEFLAELKTEWYKVVNAAISPNVYKDSVPITENGSYVLIRSEGSTNTDTTNSGFFRSAIIVVDIVTKYPVIGSQQTAYALSNDISAAVLLSPNSFSISLTNHQITQITLQSQDEIYEDDNSEKIFRVINRYEHFLNQI